MKSVKRRDDWIEKYKRAGGQGGRREGRGGRREGRREGGREGGRERLPTGRLGRRAP
jgi:hypothetical protein